MIEVSEARGSLDSRLFMELFEKCIHELAEREPLKLGISDYHVIAQEENPKALRILKH